MAVFLSLLVNDVVIAALLPFLKSYLLSYVDEKAKNLATIDDIRKITEETEIAKAHYQLKYDACLAALGLVDAYFSHVLTQDNKTPTKQYATAKEARECHNKLILTCKDPEILLTFAEIMFGSKDSTQNKEQATAPTDLLNKFRNLVRVELGFGKANSLDRKRAWFPDFTAEPNP